MLAVDEMATNIDVLHIDQGGRMRLDSFAYADIATVGNCTNRKRDIHAKGWHEDRKDEKGSIKAHRQKVDDTARSSSRVL